MLRALIVAILIGSGLAGSIVQRSDNSQQTQTQQEMQQLLTAQISDPYSSSQGNQLHYQYPSYPEYSNTEHEPLSESEKNLIPVTSSSLPTFPFTTSLGMSLIPLARTVATYGVQIGTYLLHFVLVLAVGGLVTTLICTFTPLCSIYFMGPTLNKFGVTEQVADLARTYITPESVNAATVLVTRAIDKYNAMQRERREKPKQTRR